MGGWNSGRHSGRPAVEDGLSLNLSRLLNQQVLRPGQVICGSIRWTVLSTGEERDVIGYEADLRAEDSGRVRLHYTISGQPRDYWVQLVTSRCNYGGLRWWFLCPISQRRCLKLQLPPGGTIFAARQVYRLAYRSQRKGAMDRSHARQRRIYARLGVEYHCYDELVPRRPEGMRRATYDKLRAQLLRAFDQHEDAFLAGAARFLGKL